MSDAEQAQADGAVGLALARLEAVVEQAVEERGVLAGELREARKRLGDLEAALGRPEGGGGVAAALRADQAGESAKLRETVARLEGENARLRRRISEGLETVEGLLSRLDSGSGG